MKNNYPYPSKYDITEALGMCRRSFVDRFAQERGLFIFGATKEIMADQLSMLYFEDSDVEAIRQHASRINNKKATVGFIIAAKDSSFDPTETVEGLRAKQTGTQYELSAVSAIGEDRQIGEMTYHTSKPGRIELLQKEPRTVKYSIDKLPANQYQIFVEAESSSDARFFESMFKGAVEDEASVDSIVFNMLTAPQTIQFFDDLTSMGLGAEWETSKVNELTFRKPTQLADTDSETEDDDVTISEDGASDEVLSIINRAILEGSDLRENPFVKQSEKDGYRFSAMTIEYAKKDVALFVEMRAEFKLRPEMFELRVNSYKKRVQEDGVEKNSVEELTDEIERQLITKFWQSAKTVYDSIVVSNSDEKSEAAVEPATTPQNRTHN